MVYEDKQGYLRDTYGDLIHRRIAYQQIYQKNLKYYESRYGKGVWEELAVHHINGIKKDNAIPNLFICSQKEHDLIHSKQIENKKRFSDKYEIQFFLDSTLPKVQKTLPESIKPKKKRKKKKSKNDKYIDYTTKKKTKRESKKMDFHPSSIVYGGKKVKFNISDTVIGEHRRKLIKELREKEREKMEEEREKARAKERQEESKRAHIRNQKNYERRLKWREEEDKKWKKRGEDNKKRIKRKSRIRKAAVIGVIVGLFLFIFIKFLYMFIIIPQPIPNTEPTISTPEPTIPTPPPTPKVEPIIVTSDKTNVIITNNLEETASVEVHFKVDSNWFNYHSEETKIFEVSPKSTESFMVYNNQGCVSAPCGVSIVNFNLK